MAFAIIFTPKNPKFAKKSISVYAEKTKEISKETFRGSMSDENLNAIFRGEHCRIELKFDTGEGYVEMVVHGISSATFNGEGVCCHDLIRAFLYEADTLRLEKEEFIVTTVYR